MCHLFECHKSFHSPWSFAKGLMPEFLQCTQSCYWLSEGVDAFESRGQMFFKMGMYIFQ